MKKILIAAIASMVIAVAATGIVHHKKSRSF